MRITQQLLEGMQEQKSALEAAVSVLLQHQKNALTGYGMDAIMDHIDAMREEIETLASSARRFEIKQKMLSVI